MKNLFVLLIVLGIAAGGATYHVMRKPVVNPATSLRTATIHRGDLLSTVSATGTVEAEEVVNVGAQVAGLIVGFGDDPRSPSKYVDYCSVVEKDQVLARIDPTVYEAALEQAEATLQNSEANLLHLEARFRKAQREWKRAESLLCKKAIAETDYDTVLSDYESAKANVASGRAVVRQNTASVKTARINLGYCTIKSAALPRVCKSSREKSARKASPATRLLKETRRATPSCRKSPKGASRHRARCRRRKRQRMKAEG